MHQRPRNEEGVAFLLRLETGGCMERRLGVEAVRVQDELAAGRV